MSENQVEQREDIMRLAEDLAFIKKAVNKSGSILQYMEVSKALRLVALITGALLIIFPALFYFFILKYGGYELIPAQVKLVLYIAIGLAFVAVGALKIRNFFVRAREINEQITLIQFVEAIYTDRFLTLLIPFFLTLIILPLYFSFSGLEQLAMPLLMIFFALLCFALSILFYMQEMVLLGTWLLLTGIVFLIWLPGLAVLLQLMIGFGIGFLIMAAGSYLPRRRKA